MSGGVAFYFLASDPRDFIYDGQRVLWAGSVNYAESGLTEGTISDNGMVSTQSVALTGTAEVSGPKAVLSQPDV